MMNIVEVVERTSPPLTNLDQVEDVPGLAQDHENVIVIAGPIDPPIEAGVDPVVVVTIKKTLQFINIHSNFHMYNYTAVMLTIS